MSAIIVIITITKARSLRAAIKKLMELNTSENVKFSSKLYKKLIQSPVQQYPDVKTIMNLMCKQTL